jgi:dTDP-4-amino-4,6-dideoxygalactose transaminase
MPAPIEAAKLSLDDLALFGGAPRFKEPLHVGRPNFAESRARFMARVGEILESRFVTNNGPLVQELEARIAETLRVAHCVAVVNGTLGLELLARALDLSGEVIVPGFTFIATAHAFEWVGLRPVFCDVDPRSHALDPGRLEGCLSAETSAVVGVHLWGEPCDVEALQAFAERHRLSLLFDAAHAFGCSRGGRMLGGFGRAEVFSFHATKFFHTFEGGAITTNDAALAARLRLLRNFGFAGYDSVVDVGTNAKMNELCAAMGLVALEELPQRLASNRDRWEQYKGELGDLPGLRLFPLDQSEARNYQYLVVEVDAAAARLSRDQLMALLQAENVLARRYFYPGCHRMEPYRSRPGPALRPLPVTERLSESVLVLPTGSSVGPLEVRGVCELLRFALEHAESIGRKLREREAG